MPPGVDVLFCSLDEFEAALKSENRTLKRALTDQRIVSGIGNAYSDEILHRARLSPLTLTSRPHAPSYPALFTRSRESLLEWIDRLARRPATTFPKR